MTKKTQTKTRRSPKRGRKPSPAALTLSAVVVVLLALLFVFTGLDPLGLFTEEATAEPTSAPVVAVTTAPETVAARRASR